MVSQSNPSLVITQMSNIIFKSFFVVKINRQMLNLMSNSHFFLNNFRNKQIEQCGIFF